MKQHILTEDLNQLSDKGKEKLREWWKPALGDVVQKFSEITSIVEHCGSPECECPTVNDKEFDDGLPLLTIGRMIEFLDEHEDSSMNALCFDRGEFYWNLYTIKGITAQGQPSIRCVELCDALWAKVKTELEAEL